MRLLNLRDDKFKDLLKLKYSSFYVKYMAKYEELKLFGFDSGNVERLVALSGMRSEILYPIG